MTLTLRILQIDVPERRLDEVVAFWAGALSAEPVEPPGPFVHLAGATSAVEVHVQAIGDSPPRYHLDLEADDRAGEVARLVAAGATELSGVDEDGCTVLADPIGLPLCVIDPEAAAPTTVAPARPDRGYLGSILVDVPPSAVDRTVGFWTTALGLDPEATEDEPPYRALHGARGPGGPVLLVVQALGPATAPRLHVDLAAEDVAAEVRRLVELGARRVAKVEDWVTLSDPVGNLLCVVPPA